MDIVNVDDTGSLLPEADTLTATTLSGLGMPNGITYGNLAARWRSRSDPAAITSPSSARKRAAR